MSDYKYQGVKIWQVEGQNVDIKHLHWEIFIHISLIKSVLNLRKKNSVLQLCHVKGKLVDHYYVRFNIKKDIEKWPNRNRHPKQQGINLSPGKSNLWKKMPCSQHLQVHEEGCLSLLPAILVGYDYILTELYNCFFLFKVGHSQILDQLSALMLLPK